MESEDDYLTSDAELDTDVEEDLDPGQEQELGVWLDQLNAFQQVRHVYLIQGKRDPYSKDYPFAKI